VIKIVCERCKAKGVMSKRIRFEGSQRSLCPDCVHSFERWLHGAAQHTGPYEPGVRS